METDPTRLIESFTTAGFILLREQRAVRQKRGLEYVYVHPKLDEILGVKGSWDDKGYRYYLKRMQDSETADYGLNAQKRAGSKLETMSGISTNAIDSFSRHSTWIEPELSKLLEWIRVNTGA